MATLTRRQSKAVIAALVNLRRARAYLASDRIAICSKGGVPTTTKHAVTPDGVVYYELAKWSGSELCLLDTAIHDLQRFFEENGGNA